MKKRSSILFLIFRSITMIITFMLSITLEKPSDERFSEILSFFVIFFIWIHIRDVFGKRYPMILPFSFAVDIILLVMLDNSSKFIVNYYFNIYYFYILISAGYLLEHKQRLIVSLGIITAACAKYYWLIKVALAPDGAQSETDRVYNMPFVLSYILFTFLIFATVAIFFNYSRLLTEEKSRLDKLNQELQDANELLEEKNEKIKELTIFEERNRIAREIHDSVGHNLTGLIMNLDFCEKLIEADEPKLKDQISASRNIAKECLVEIRKSVQALKPHSIEQLPLIKSIQDMVLSSKQKFNIEVNFEIKGEIYKTRPDCNIVIFRAVQEAITNSVKHGMADRIDILIAFGKSELSLLIKDNGHGAEKLNMGNGLTGMTERINGLNGKISFYSKDGFMINISIPIESV